MIPACDLLIEQGFASARPGDTEPRHAVDRVDRQAEPVGLVADRQLQRRVDVPLLLVAAHVDVVLAGPAVGQPVDQPGVGVEVEDHRLVRGEQRLELPVRHAVRMLGVRHEPDQVHHVDEPDLQVGQMLAEQRGGGQRLHRRHVAATRHDHVGLGALVVARPVPDAGALGAVRDRRVHVEILQVHLLVGDDDVDVIGAAQAVVGHRQQAVGVGRQIDAHDARALVGDDVEQAGVLVA